MSVVDSRVVEMGFDNTKFGAGVSGTISMLDKLKASLGMQGASKGLQDINAAAQKFDSSQMEQGASRIGGAFTSMQAVAFGALANIGAKISETAMHMAKSFTIEPLTEGFHEYETNMKSIQTVMANTGLEGDKGLGQVNHALEELNHYSDQTIYNFSEMAKNIGTFTAAGVDLDTSTAAIKGIANLAAVSGSNSEQASGAMYQLSQALAAGKVSLMDWNSVVNAGMGGKVFQNALKETARAHGVAVDDIIKKSGSFRESISGGESWLSAEILTDTLQTFTGDLDAAQLKQMGYNEDQIQSILKMGKTATDAATKVKTFSQLMSTLKEGVSSGWAKTFQILIGDFNQAKELFTSINKVVGGFFGRMSDARNDLLQSFVNMGGRKASIQALGNAFGILGRIITPIVQAFRDIFPASTAVDLIRITVAVRDFLAELTPAPETMDRLRRTFAGVFAVLGIGWEIIKAVAKFLFDMFAGIEEGDKGILKFTATIGDFLVGLHKAIKEGEGLTHFFEQVRDLLFKVINPIKDFGQFLGNVFAGIDIGNAGAGLGAWINNLLDFGTAAEKTGEAVGEAVNPIKQFFEFFWNIAKAVGDFVKPIFDNIASAFEGWNYDDIIKGMQTGLLAGLVVVIKQLGGIFSGLSIFGGNNEGPGLVDKIKDSLDGLTGTLSAMQANLKASMLLKIAVAVAALAISVVLLAGVDAAGLARATAALTVMFIQLAVAMSVFQKIGTVASIAKMNLMGAALILLGVAILILVAAVRLLSRMSWEELAKGLGALVVLMGVLVGMSRGLDKSRGAILRASAALILMGIALRVLVHVVRVLGEMNIETLRQGLISVGILLLGLVVFSRLQGSPANVMAQAAAILLLALALKVLAGVVTVFGKMSWAQLAKGFVGIAAGITLMGIALKFMPSGPSMLLTAFSLGKVATVFMFIAKAFQQFEKISWGAVARGLLAVSGALLAVTGTLKYMPKISLSQIVALMALAWAIQQIVDSLVMIGDMDMDQVGKSMLVFSGVLGTIVFALNMMKGSAEGAASIAAVAASFEFLSGILSEWGAMSWEEIAKGLGAFIGLLAVMTISLSLLKTEAAGAAALALVAGALSLLVPALVTLGAMPLLAIAAAIFGLAGIFLVLVLGLKLLAPVLPVLMGMAGAIALLGLAVALAGVGLLAFSAGITALSVAGAAGIAALVAMISAIAGMIPMVAEQIGLGIVALLVAIGNSADALVKATVQILGALLDAIIQLAPKLGATLLVLLRVGLAVIVRAIPMFVDAGLKLIIGLLRGIANNIGSMVDAAVDIIVAFVNGITRNLPRIIQAGFDMIIALMNGIGDAARNNGKALGEAGGNMATGIIEGIIEGLKGLGGQLIDMFTGMLGDMWDAGLNWLGIASPSKRYMQMGKWIMQGLAKGLTGNRGEIEEAFNATRKELSATIDEADTRIKEILKRRAELRKEGKGTGNKEYDALTKQLAKLRRESEKATAARSHLVKNLDDERDRLKKLADQYDKNAVALDEANQKLKDAKQVRDDYNKSIRDQYGDMEDITAETNLGDYISNLEKQIVETQEFTSKIQELRRMGLNDELYKELLAKGPEAMPFIEELLSGGQIRIDQLNTLTKTLDRDAEILADKSAAALYQAGVNAAAGLVEGLEAKQKNIEDLMEKIADSMVNSLKKKLGIKSPSRIFAELGAQANAGLAQGLDRTASVVGKSAESVGDKAMTSLKDSLSNVTKMIGPDMNMNPVIAPVLDLSNVRRDAASIGSLLAARPLNVTGSYSRASDASTGYNQNQVAAAEAAIPTAGDTIVFEQHNYSPKALSNAEIYRQTNNQLSRAKGALTGNAK